MTTRQAVALDGVRPDEVHVVRVFADAHGRHGNELGIVLASARTDGRELAIAQALGFSETVFVDAVDAPGADPRGASIRILTPARELPFAGHPTVGTAWWLASRGVPVNHLRVPAGTVRVTRAGDEVRVTADPDWGPDFTWQQHPTADALRGLDADAVDPAFDHLYAWTWTDEAAGEVRARMFAPALGVVEDEATGSAALRLTARLGRDLRITQGRGSVLVTRLHDDGRAEVGGRTVPDRVIPLP
ncbi:PhzF family phenazine biosynthesis protein [Clavibacter michiganensis]|uniref:PhzF family phenazine biosynthesis protein n=2 Tax=Clavibacter michiganensis TaxID=28447 RepID=UPI0009A6D751|nr:PhzF family phenazine biosynthesis protein [Clavibacter michiganensis]MBF4637404.1 PhzF family phenazine biosynthesis protein [Clavibacter michiganensis subsp. michiganensis]MDO4018328.1 PhzF family phenazine biosynthesis protein [Clavibacter michiganensis]MDO4027064.1 PhzF family phenazine biosynthesis protein [Clavibacter michiganensis]MDO4035016.1 PhzF family phenazine biosynthesis protein [Clavibacter michiganensis]MDO4039435.1 PhzF family phenazine biosynthesis protein [Clavibacter mic